MQFEIENFILKNKSKVKPTSPILSNYLQEIEVALLLDDILAMNRAKAIELTLSEGDYHKAKN